MKCKPVLNSLRFRSLAVLSILGLLSIGAPVDAQQGSTPSQGFDERVDVVEVSVLVEFPDLSRGRIANLVPEDLIVTEGGAVRPVSRLVPLDDRGAEQSVPWNVLIYVDDVLSSPRTLELTLRSVSQHASELIALGPVTVLRSSSSEPLLEASSSIVETADLLGQLARSGLGQDSLTVHRLDASRRLKRISGESLEPLSRELRDAERELLRSMVDRLMLAGARCDFAPCLMVWISDGFDTSAPYYPEVVGPGVDNRDLADELAQGLAARGWTVLGVALRKPAPPMALTLEGSGTDYDAWKRDSGGVQMPNAPSRKTRIDRSSPESQEMWILPRFLPHRELLVATAGGMARLEWQFEEELARLERRWWLLYRRPSSAWSSAAELETSSADGSSRDTKAVEPLEIRFAADSEFARKRRLGVRLGVEEPIETVRAPRFASRGGLATMAPAILRRFLADGPAALAAMGSAAAGENRFEVTLTDGQGRAELEWSYPGQPAVPGQDDVPVEVVVRTTVLDSSGRIESSSRRIDVVQGRLRLPVEPADGRALLIEELSPSGAVERFGLLDLGARP